GAADIDGVHDVIEHMPAGGHGGRCYDVGHEIDAEIAAAISQQLENFIGLVAGVRIDGRASGMGDENRLGGFGDRSGGGAVSAVTEVDGYSEVVHLLD